MSEKTDILKKLDSYKDYANSYQQKQKGSTDLYDLATNEWKDRNPPPSSHTILSSTWFLSLGLIS